VWGGGSRGSPAPAPTPPNMGGGGGGLCKVHSTPGYNYVRMQLVWQMPRTGLVPSPLLDFNSIHLHIKK
jgi:hypothetical protein